uniref:Kelch repeat-containing protein n=1 Tax=Panagrolaimus sp. PS1159 TaxID=55785 RepID=A0AC35G5P3_9BILA
MKIVVIGGCTEPLEEGCLKCCEIFDDNGNGSLIENVLNFPRRGSAFALNNEFIYVFGGCSGPGKHLKTIEKIDKSFEATVIENEIEAEGSCFAYCSINNSFFVAGGFNGIECLNSASLFTFLPCSQSSSFRLPTPLKNSAACKNPFNSNSILLFGGWDESRTLNSIFNVLLTDFTATMDALLPYHVEGHTTTLIDNSIIFLIGGYNGIKPISTISKFDKNGTQILDENLEIPRENHCTVFLEETREIWIIGGWNGNETIKIIERFKVSKNGDLKKLSNFSLNKARQKAGAVVFID